jgi:hypothetical protein
MKILQQQETEGAQPTVRGKVEVRTWQAAQMEDAKVAQSTLHAWEGERFQLTLDVRAREYWQAHLPADAHQVRHVGGVLVDLARTMSGKETAQRPR